MWALLLACHTTRLGAQGLAEVDDFRAFLEAAPERAVTYLRFEEALRAHGVVDVVPPWHLWRQGTDWRSVGQPPFADPAPDQWDAIVPTLVFLRDEVVPVTGPVVVVSGFRTNEYNALAGGADGSRHKWFEAVDVVPVRWWFRDSLHRRLLAVWSGVGSTAGFGLGLYEGTRFHVDTHRHRRW